MLTNTKPNNLENQKATKRIYSNMMKQAAKITYSNEGNTSKPSDLDVESKMIQMVCNDVENQIDIMKHYTCSHDIVILLGYTSKKEVYRCMFCGTDQIDDIKLKKCCVVNATNYHSELYDMENPIDVEKKFSIIRNEILKNLEHYPEITIGQLANLLNQSLNCFNKATYQKKKYI